MSLNLAAVAQAVTDTVPAVPFINWQYVYCWIISIFGLKCTTNTPTIPDVTVPGVDGVVDSTMNAAQGAASTASDPGFWSWLWPFHGGASTAVDAGSVASSVDVASLVPGPIVTAVHFVGTVLSGLWHVFSFLSYTASTLLVLGILGALAMLAFIRITEWSTYSTLPPRASGKSYGWSRWQDLLDAAMATEPKRWREGILQADAMLGELLTKIGYAGDATSDQLRRVPDGAFVTLPQAWEAHRIKNFVSQRSSNFILTQREAFRVMKLYEQVFEEFNFI